MNVRQEKKFIKKMQKMKNEIVKFCSKRGEAEPTYWLIIFLLKLRPPHMVRNIIAIVCQKRFSKRWSKKCECKAEASRSTKRGNQNRCS